MSTASNRERETDRKKAGSPPGGWRALFGYRALMLVFLWIWQDASGPMSQHTLAYSEFKAYLPRGEVAECAVGQDEIDGRIVPKPTGKAAATEWGSQKGETPGASPFPFRTVRVEDRKKVPKGRLP